MKPPAVISKPATEAVAPQPKKNVKPKSGNNKPKEAKALTALDKAKLRKKKLERMRAEISTTIMGLQSCVAQESLTSSLTSLAGSVEQQHKILLAMIKDGLTDDSDYAEVISTLNKLECDLEEPLAQGKGLAISASSKKRKAGRCTSVCIHGASM